WIDKPEVLIDYPKVVPDFGFKKASFFEKKVITPIKEWLKTVNKLFDFFSGSVFDSFSSKTLEKIEENENLKGVSEEIKILEQEIEETLGDAEEGDSSDLIQEKFSEEIDRLNEENEESLIFKENMTDEEIRTLLIAIYNELKKRKEAINELKDDKNEVEDIEEKEIEEKEEKEETKKETEIISYCSYNNQSSLRSNLIINEVAWMGTNNSSSDEWIELKNISNQEIDLNNYQLLNKDNEIKIILKDLKIAPGGYILLERTDDNSVSGIKADLIYKGGLSNSSESIYLFNNNCILEDFVEASPNWPAGDNSNKKSMERKLDLTWKTYSGDFFGTPRAENSQESSVFILPSGGGISSDPIEEEAPITYCSQTDLEESLKTPVVINEVAWMGTDISSSDEWIELKNLTDENVSLYGWQLLDKDNNIKIVFEEDDVILANDYYLLERTDDTTISSILADKIYVGALNNTDESLRLFNNTCQLIDEVKADSDWPAGEASKSMERKSDLTWKTYSGDSFGTPRAENSAEISEASSYCLSNGGIIEKRISLGGNYNVCVFDDGKECEEEAMYLGKCPLYGVDTSFYSNDKEKYCVLKGGEVDVMGENLCNFPYMKTCNLDDLFSGKCSDNIYATSLVITEINDGYNKEEREYVTIFNQSGSDISLCSGESCTYLTYFVGDEINSTKWNNPVLNIPLSDLLLENNSSYQIDLNKDNRGDYAPILDPVSSDGYLGISNASICLFNKNVELLSEESAEEAKIDCVGWRRSDEISYNNVKEGSEIYKAGIQFNQALFRAKDSETNKYLDRENNIVDFISSKPTVYTIPDVSNFSFTEIEDKTKLKLSWDFDSSLDASKLSYKIYYTENSSFDEDNLEQILEEDTIKTDNHIETIVSIQQDIDYRFRVITFEEGGNVSDNKNFIFYVSFSSFNDHPYGLFRYNSNKNNKVNYLGPQSGIAKNNLIESDTIFRATPLIDQFGNFYVTQAGESSAYVRVASYD
ncbi:MAG: lamin tail domain-containing protein, partial [Candidatus Pacebacteria bacterium]|nr:lamin tail domain-containing protein [Candidatus Paceibacterota bacterium]